jgi:uncharacterized protein YecT (DUF1311 family)
MNAYKVLALLVLMLTSASAQDTEKSCDGTTVEMSACEGAKYKKADAELNAVYQNALASASKYTQKDVANLRDAQRKWVIYRDAACEAEYGLWGNGTGAPLARVTCLLRVTKQRMADLKGAYDTPH